MLGMSFKKLQIWQKGIVLVRSIYEQTRSFPKEEMYGLTSQMRRAAVSVPANIAEGSQRTSDKDFGNFLLIPKGSLAELHTYICIALEMKYLSEQQAASQIQAIEELDRMIRSFRLKLTP
jgi:four helix bundle protein